MFKFQVLLCLCGVLYVSPVTGQQSKQPEETSLIEKLNRVQILFLVAEGTLVGSEGLALTPEQKEAFRTLKEKRNSLAVMFEGITKGSPEERIGKLKKALAAHKELETTLTDEILLPHQAERLRVAEFKNLLSRNNGDFLLVVEKFFGDRVEFSGKQQTELEKLSKNARAKRARLHSRHREELQQLNDEIRVEIGKVLRPEQVLVLEQISGSKFSKKSNSKSDNGNKN